MDQGGGGRLLGWVLLVASAAVAVVGGWPSLSPYFDPLLYWLGRVTGPTLGRSQAVFYATTGILALIMLCIASLPAFLAGRFAPSGTKRLVRGIVRLATVVALAWPALRVAAGYEH